jgi:hypothetical protein
MSEESLQTPLEAAIDSEPAPLVVNNEQKDVAPVVIYTAGSPEDGEIVRGILEAEGIQVILTNAGSSALGEVFNVGEGQYGEVLVAAADAERANNILSAAIVPESTEE